MPETLFLKPGALITRPQPFAERTATAVAALGYQPYICPLLRFVPLAVPPATRSYDGAVFTSATVFQLGLDLRQPLDLPLYVVGSQTAVAAQAAGFSTIRHCASDVPALAAWLNAQPPKDPFSLVYYRGVHVAHDLAAMLPASMEFDQVAVYDSHVQTPSESHKRLLLGGAVQWILLYSRRTSGGLAAAINGMDDTSWCPETSVLCLSSAVMEPLYEFAWRSIEVAATPDEAAMLARLRNGLFERDGDGEQGQP